MGHGGTRISSLVRFACTDLDNESIDGELQVAEVDGHQFAPAHRPNESKDDESAITVTVGFFLFTGFLSCRDSIYVNDARPE
jgi:hypothetical protein